MLLNSSNSGVITLVETAIEQKSIVEFLLHSGEKITMFPLKLLHLAGEIRVVGEDIYLKHIIDICLEDIKSSLVVSSDLQATSTLQEVDFFIKQLRELEGGAIRLVLKISKMLENIGSPDKLHYLGNPYMTTNVEGDFIWAATIEADMAIFEWLFCKRHYISILDPAKFKQEFDRYCEYRMKQAA